LIAILSRVSFDSSTTKVRKLTSDAFDFCAMLSVGEYVREDEIEDREREDENEGLPAKLPKTQLKHEWAKERLTYDLPI